MKPQVLLITQFEPLDGSAGEFSHFRERFQLQPIANSPLPEILFSNPAETILAVIAGVGAVQTATIITALGMDPRFDLSESLWLISGIAGGDPAQCSLGSPIFADWCIDGDLAWEIDGRELPLDWPTGLLPLGAKAPYSSPAEDGGVFGSRYEKVELPPRIIDWAREIAESTTLAQSSSAEEEGRRYAESPKASGKAEVQVGSALSAVRFWHGHLMNEWARRWVSFFTDSRGVFHTSSMEDSGTLYAFQFLCTRKLANPNNLLLIRTVSNFTRPPEGVPAVSTLVGDKEGAHMPGFELALENGFRVAEKIIRAWLSQLESLSRDA